ncbi:MAG TPA: glucose-6-phosphate dehydrogenase [Rubrobacter sp.]|nr:glucose-6-phosphate dehydrogenase [Rubrobacter sp.]
MIRRMLLLGATGDLSLRYLLPALAHLRQANGLPEDFVVECLGRDDTDTEAYRALAAEGLAEHAPDLPREVRDALTEALHYHRADVTDPGRISAVLKETDGPVVAYLSLPPQVFAPAIEALVAAGLPEGSRVVVEKPFGEDLASARELNRLLRDAFPEEAVFRVDHFLGMQTVQNVLGLRFANRVFEPLWNREHISGVEIVWEETLALEGRAGYYDAAGALKDMIQNHLLQVLCLVGMEPPATLHERDLRDRKVELLRAVRSPSPEEARRQTIRARYSAGCLGDREVPGYAEEEGVDPERGTETFAEVTLAVDNRRWSGVPFVLRSGKALSQDRAEVSIRFRPASHPTFGQEAEPNVLRLHLEPDRVSLSANVNGPGGPSDLEKIELSAERDPQAMPAYARLLLDALEGDPTLSIRADEAEESWRIVEPILRAWEQNRVPLLEYPAGSDDPRRDAPQPPG